MDVYLSFDMIGSCFLMGLRGGRPFCGRKKPTFTCFLLHSDSFPVAAFAAVRLYLSIDGQLFPMFAARACLIFRIVFFLLALPAGATQFDIDRFDAAHLGNLPWHRNPIRFDAAEVADHPALPADEVVVAIRIGIEPRPVSHGTHAGYCAAVFKQSQCPIDCVDRDGGYPPSHTHEEGFGIGMLFAGGQLPKNLGSLMSCLYPLPTADLQEIRNAFLYLFTWNHWDGLIRNDYYLVLIHNLEKVASVIFKKVSGART